MQNQRQQKTPEIQLARTLGIPEVTLLGIGALLGGGIFTLLGTAAGLAGGGLVFSMLLGSGIAFINLNAYVALATTFPQAGGGYHWVKEGLGDLSGFLSGWCSWMASAVACALYSVSFGFFMQELIFDYLHLPHGSLSEVGWEITFTLSILLLFGFINYRGVKLSGKIGGGIAMIIVGILAFYVTYGLKHMALNPELLRINFSPLLPMGLAGVIQAAALFYIAFEGSEVQAQAGEEVENPAKVLKVGLFASWAVVSIIYVFIAVILIGATDGGGISSAQFLGQASERAIIVSAEGIMPFGYLIMLIAGLLANLAALNATIYSSSRVLFSLGRDRLVFPSLGKMHPIYFIPTRALLLSLAFIAAVATFLPLKDIASAADILFIVLFMQLNIAYIQLRRQKPEAKWQYIVPFEPYLPLVAVFLYVLLAIALFHVSPLAIYFLLIWVLIGLVNYYGYAKRVEREDHAREVVYEHSTRFHPKSEYRVVLPVGSEKNWHSFAQIASAMTKEEGGDLIALRIHEMKANDVIADAFHSSRDKRVLEEIEEDMASMKMNIDTRIVASRSVPEAILDTIQSENADLVLLNWDGDVNTKGFIFGRKIDVVLHRAKCDLLTVKLGLEDHKKKVIIPVAIDANPNLRFTGKVATALCHSFDSTVMVVMVVPTDVLGKEDERFKKILEIRVRELKIKAPGQVESMLVYSDYLSSGILRVASGYDVVLLPAARGRITRAIGVGSIPEQVAKNCRRKTVLIAKGYKGIAQPFWEYLSNRF
ncbi:MAG: hypothetical protein A2845_05110 [Candidatus Lloydbacteria bacterium RIFCSPHIGHO2_01_FULL_49_22]|uniref:Uncharacterized protein n=1 Tax=Candidatus Lloydbacteria bacterium RIFCSPHIGHO2_01_FULL_49_22 TaxID=1798658 RepID=A0A1G2CUD5_9BACT|nr:MAG: hypothetical protein A2845_05110 [Candidatus Lloydbacteria bacterium RIFCSPHIGHO2_01_FULL_49_22]OGZ09507.1 MAG: hypothetical protein A3C14_01665 [Candidatus Lloydbacteria bacterium RIFCSPHIGHO2_02_FULL_50_18]